MGILILIAIIAFIALLLVGLVLFGIWNQRRLIKRNHDKEQEAYMKKHPDSYGIGEIEW